MLDATIEMVDGVMVVSPKEVKFKPNDGDVVFSGSSLISIFKEMTSDTSLSAYTALSNGELKKNLIFGLLLISDQPPKKKSRNSLTS